MEWDCHVHMILDGKYWKSAIASHASAPDYTIIRAALERWQARGVTYLRDGGDRWGVGAAARRIAPEYGIEYRTPLAPLCKAGHYGAFLGISYENEREYAGLVKNTKTNGGDFIKIMISGLMDFNTFGRLTEEGLTAREITSCIHIAHEEGMAVMVHGNGAANMEAAANAGADSIEHGAYADDAALHAMAENGTVWVPTLSTIGNLRGKGRFDERAVEKILESAMENTAAFAAAGGMIAPGSDAGAFAVPHGCDTEEGLLLQALGEGGASLLRAGAETIRRKFVVR